MSSRSDDAARLVERSGSRKTLVGRRRAARAGDPSPPPVPPPPGRLRGLLPRGSTLDDETFERRHLFLCWVLALHVPALFALGSWRRFDLAHLGLELVVPAVCVVFARLAADRRVASFFVVAGLVYCSAVLVHFSGGAIEAHFHFFILVGLVVLYQDWVPFLWYVVLTVLVHGAGGAVEADLLFSHDSGHERPWTWAAVHALAVLAACGAQVVFWKSTEEQQDRNVELASTLATSDDLQRRSTSELLVNLARRNQSLLNRQLELITDLELRDHDPEVLDELSQLDHLATRIRRNAESLLVLAGDEPSRRWGTPVPLARVVRSAAGEVEDNQRIEVVVNNHIEVAGKAVADLAHLLTELIENATTFSPPASTVRVRSQLAPDRPTATVISVEDQGIGMSQRDLEEVNGLLAEAPEVDLGRSTMLGFHVVARLARRHGVTVRLAATPGGGLTALVTLPEDLVSERLADPPVALPGADRAIAPWVGPDGGRLARLSSLAPFGGPADRAQPPAPAALPEGRSTRRDADAVTPGPGPVAEPAIVEPAPIALPPASPPAPTPVAPASPLAPAPVPPADPAAPAPVPDLPQMTPPSWWFESAAFLPGPARGATAQATATGSPVEASPATPAPDATPLGPGAAAPAATAPMPASAARPSAAPPPLPGPAAPGAPSWPVDTPPRAPGPTKTSVWPIIRPDAPAGAPAAGGVGQPAAPAGAPAAGGVGEVVAPEGLVRRVPGANLAPFLRRDTAASGPAPAAPPTARRDPDQVRSMLSTFQASQRAGREAAEATPAAPPEEKS